jgi:hypothetical protein
MNPEKEYAKLRKKNKEIPDWKWIRTNFRPIIYEGHFLEQLREEISDRIHQAKNTIEPLIAGSENYCCWFEKKFLTAAEREEMFNIYKDLLSLVWSSNRLNVDFDEKNYIEWLLEVKRIWSKWRERMSYLFEKISTSWKEYEKEEEETVYRG